ncbi:MAG: OmpH family outer membrane protein [Vicinamibacterales bacterium]
MVRRTTLAVVLGLALLPAVAGAQTPPPPAAPAPQTAPAPPLAPLPADTRFGIVNLQVVFNESTVGKQAVVQVNALQAQLQKDLQARADAIQSLGDRIRTQASVTAEVTLREWNVDLARLQREAQFAQQEAEVRVQQLRDSLLDQFEQKVLPIVEAVRAERGLAAVFSIQNSDAPGALNVIAIDPRVNLSAEVVRRLDAAGS